MIAMRSARLQIMACCSIFSPTNAKETLARLLVDASTPGAE